jgi:acylphosphatase
MVRHISILVTGKVQGVFFRATTKAKADELGVKGFVRNQPDGGVYIEAEADPLVLSAFESWCKMGPPRARVERIDVTGGDLKFYSDFSVQ